MLELDAQARSSAPPGRVWAPLADASTWPQWADCHADVRLTPEGGGTEIRWHSTLRAKVPGTGRLVRSTLRASPPTRPSSSRAADHP